MHKIRNKIASLFIIVIILIIYSCGKNKVLTQKDVLVLAQLNSSEKGSIDSIVFEYTYIDSITQCVEKTFYCKAEKLLSLKYKLINKETKAYIEPQDDTIRSIYLDISTHNNIIARSFGVPIKYLNGDLEYKGNMKDSMDNVNYYVFQGRDIGYTYSLGIFNYYFDSIFHLKKIYNERGELLFSIQR